MRPRKFGRGNPEDQTLLQAGDFPRHVPCVNVAGLGALTGPWFIFSFPVFPLPFFLVGDGVQGPKQFKHR